MSRKCLKCGEHVPKYIWIDGKKRNCQRRKYCFDCSPFGKHNTKQLDVDSIKGQGLCKICGRPTQKGTGSRKCFMCYFREKEVTKIKKVQSIVGTSCWICKYDKTWKNLCFHHVDSKLKKFGLSSRELVGYSWDKVYAEMQKCILVCKNCHGEIHDGLIVPADVQKVYSRWRQL